MIDPNRLEATYLKLRNHLWSLRQPEGYWVGELSTSALSTATAIAALEVVCRVEPNRREQYQPVIRGGLRWLATHQNEDGGWGDTTKSFSNISTTMLGRAAMAMCDSQHEFRQSRERSESWLSRDYGKTPEELAESIRRRYGKDRTFAVPILTMSALAGLVSWKEVPRLPFELACLPQSWYRFVRLPVVSYALPALIAIGQCVHHHRGTWNPITWSFRKLGRKRSLTILQRIQPSSGGYLEATPLTSFVVMSLAGMKQPATSLDRSKPGDRVIEDGLTFIFNSVRSDGSWPIDTNLSIWVTNLAIQALAAGDDIESISNREQLIQWILAQQTQERHPFTGADPFAWGWSHLPGSVPDCDDTPGALLALSDLQQNLDHSPLKQQIDRARSTGLAWLKNLQNRDGGWPTFCRGWGALPFDRSGSDLTAHALRAWNRCEPIDMPIQERAILNALNYLRKQQRSDGSWLPLWFGNQYAPDDENPVYGTARVLACYRDLQLSQELECERGVQYLLKIQREDGSWGDPQGKSSSMEETAQALDVLIPLAAKTHPEKIANGINWLIEQIEVDAYQEPSPIGFYFAKLWYFEQMYPITYTLSALGRMRRLLQKN